LGIEGRLQSAALMLALRSLTRRHRCCGRRCGPGVEGRIDQVIEDEVRLPIETSDLCERESPADAVVAIARELTTEPVAFDIAPLWRGVLARTANERHVLVLAVHHAIWILGCRRVLLEDLVALYGAALVGREEPLACGYGSLICQQRSEASCFRRYP